MTREELAGLHTALRDAQMALFAALGRAFPVGMVITYRRDATTPELCDGPVLGHSTVEPGMVIVDGQAGRTRLVPYYAIQTPPARAGGQT